MTPKHLKLLDDHLVALANRDIKRLLVMMPPRHGKSVLISQFFPAWYLGVNPDHRVILASYEASFAAGWGRKTRDLLHEFGADQFQVQVRTDSSAAHHWNLRGRFGGMTTAGVGGPITGRGADLLIVDDPVKNAEQALSETYRDKTWEWWTSTAFTRLEPDAVAVVVQTRWHDDDLVGRIEKRQAEEDWRVLRLPALSDGADELGRTAGEALWPERFPTERLAAIQRSLPLHWWESIYQQRPGRHTRVLWPLEYFEGDDLWFDEWPSDLRLRVLTLDPSKGRGASHSDYSAYVLLGVAEGGTVFVEADLSNTRPPSQLVEDGVRHYANFAPDAFRIEGNAWQDLLAPMFVAGFKQHGILAGNIGQMENRVSKRLRIETLDGLLRDRQFRFRRTKGTELLVDQLKNFPVARHDDGPDALEMAVRTARELWNHEPVESVSPWNLRGGLV
ncbi:MAG: terminase family protein [Planctomycetales bacterium]|nr:terminase family protein [Planctomycetales bacterium]